MMLKNKITCWNLHKFFITYIF